MSEENTRRRQGKRGWFVILGLFVLVFAISFLVTKCNNDDTMAANMGAFDPGYIMSDWQMGNYKSMNESQIQTFLKSKNSCYDTNIGKYTVGDKVGYFSETSPPRTWHIKDGHFVCMADEVFNGGTAAHIIWQAAQDYRINPQVLLVLLEKEQSLVTDTFPHSQQYRSATGYGCPDTAPCSSKYYGLKNQIRKAAELFRTVLDGGWTNYPLGWNYVQYNPNTACGGTWVNIRSLATSALYRYTPYQPNAAALEGWNDGCGAYGNKNFYQLFEDWFGGITSTGYSWMDTPRYMINIETGEIKMYKYKREDSQGLCLSDSDSNNHCTLYKKLKNVDWQWNNMETARYLTGNKNTVRVDLNEGSNKTNLNGATIYYNKKTVLPDGTQCLLPENQKYSGWCAVFETMKEATFEEREMSFSRTMEARATTYFIDATTKKRISKANKGSRFYFSKKVYLPDVGTCLITENRQGCVLEADLKEVWNEMQSERMMVVKEDTYKINIYTNQYDNSVLMNKGMERRFVSKTYHDGEWCLRTEYDDEGDNNNCVPLSKLGETWEKLENEETRKIKAGSQKKDAFTLNGGLTMNSAEYRVFVSKIYITSLGKWCYRTQYDEDLNTNYCFLENNIE